MALHGPSTDNFTLDNTTSSPIFQGERVEIPPNILYGVCALNGILACLGICGNVTVCLIIARGRKMYTVTNMFLMNLAVADTCVLVILYPLFVIHHTIPFNWPFGSVLCKILPSVTDSFMGISVGCMTVISIHRYRMIIYAMYKQLDCRQARLIIAVIWVVSLMSISAPFLPIMKYQLSVSVESHDNVTFTRVFKDCWPKYPSADYFRYYQIYLVAACYVLPLMIIFYTFIRIRLFFRKTLRFQWLDSSEKPDLADHAMKIKKAMRMLAPVVTAFSILMLPQAVFRLVAVASFPVNPPYSEVFALLVGTAALANCVINPFIYYIFSREFRTEFRKQLWLLKRCLKLTRSQSTEFTIEQENGKMYVRRFKSMTAEKEAQLRREEQRMNDQRPIERQNTFISMLSNTPTPPSSNGFLHEPLAAPNFDEMFRSYANGEYNMRMSLLHDIRPLSVLPEIDYKEPEEEKGEKDEDSNGSSEFLCKSKFDTGLAENEHYLHIIDSVEDMRESCDLETYHPIMYHEKQEDENANFIKLVFFNVALWPLNCRETNL